MPSLLDADQLSAGSSLFTAVMRAGLLLGPALGGLCEERVFGVGVLSEQHAGLFPGDFLHDVVDDLGFWLIPWTRTPFIVREHYIPRHPCE